MDIFRMIEGWFGGDSLDRPSPASRSGHNAHENHHISERLGSPRRIRESSPGWWKRSPEDERSTVHFCGADMDLAKRVTVRVNTGRIPTVPLPEALRVMILLVQRNELIPERVAHVLVSAPDMPPAMYQYLLCGIKRPPANPPATAEDWQAVLEQCDLADFARVLFTHAARDIYLGGPSSGSIESDTLWEHALATAMVTDHLSQAYHFNQQLLATLAALLHDIGHVAVLWTLLDSMQPTHTPEPPLLADLCRRLHEEAGTTLARFWHLPEGVTHIIGHHHQKLDPASKHGTMQALVQLADESVLRCGHRGFEYTRHGPLLDCEFASALKLTDTIAQRILEPVPDIALQATLAGGPR